MSADDIPRRIRLDKMTAAELAIWEAAQAVEAAGADVRLTEAVILLGRARDKVADFVDGVGSGSVVPAPAEKLLSMLRDGGRVVSTASLSAPEIVVARADDRMWVDADGFGYVYLPPGRPSP